MSTPVMLLPGGFTFNQFLVTDEQPLLFHTGPRRMFPLVREAVVAVVPGRCCAATSSRRAAPSTRP